MTSELRSQHQRALTAWSTGSLQAKNEKMARFRAFEAAGHVGTPEEIAEFLNEALKTKDATFITKAIGLVLRARSIASVARKAGVNRENLYRSFGGHRAPKLDTLISVLDAIDIEIAFEPERGREGEPSTTKESASMTREGTVMTEA